MYVCMYVNMYTCIYVCMYVCICVYMYICIYVYMYICIYVYVYICRYVYVYICICTLCIYMVVTRNRGFVAVPPRPPLLHTLAAGPLLQTRVAGHCVEYCSLQSAWRKGSLLQDSLILLPVQALSKKCRPGLLQARCFCSAAINMCTNMQYQTKHHAIRPYQEDISNVISNKSPLSSLSQSQFSRTLVHGSLISAMPHLLRGMPLWVLCRSALYTFVAKCVPKLLDKQA